MHQYLRSIANTSYAEGDFIEERVVTMSGEAFCAHPGFMVAFSQCIMANYESQPYSKLFVLEDIELERPERTRKFYYRLFETSGSPTLEFVTLASETFALWFERTLGEAIYCEGNRAHGTDPVWDVLSIVNTATDEYILRVVQVKATAGNLQANCNVAIEKFERLENGEYAYELFNRLRHMEDSNRLPANVRARDLMYNPNKRYRVTVMHGENRGVLQILTTYNAKVRGHRDRRRLLLAHVDDWDTFWNILGSMVYAQLS